MTCISANWHARKKTRLDNEYKETPSALECRAEKEVLAHYERQDVPEVLTVFRLPSDSSPNLSILFQFNYIRVPVPICEFCSLWDRSIDVIDLVLM